MKRAFYFSVATAAVLGFATAAWAQAAGGTGGAGGAGGSAGAGASGSAGAGAASGTVGVGGAGTVGNAGSAGQAGAAGNAGRAGNAGTAGAAGVAGATNGVGAANGLGANNGVNTNNNAVNTGVNSRSGFGNTGTSGRTNANGTVGRSNLGPNAGGANGGISQDPFFSNQAVRQQLKMNDTQFNALNRAYRDAYTNYNNSLNGLGKNLTADQRNQQMEMLQNQFNDRFNQNVNSTLTDPGARARYEQLNRQYMGLSNFNNPAMQKQLNLTPQQLNQIRQLSASMRSSGSNLNGNQSQLYSQTWDQLNSILTPQQQQTWSQLTGERFDFGGSAAGVAPAQSNFGTGGQLQNGAATNGNTTPGIGSRDPKNNLTAPRTGEIVPFGTTPGTNGTGTNSGDTSGNNSNTTGGTGSTTGTPGSTSGAGTGAGGNAGSTTGTSSSK